MKKAEPGAYILWNGVLTHVSGYIDNPALVLKKVDPDECPHCGG